MNKCPWCGGETESGHTEVSGIGSGCHTLDIWYTVCASDNMCGYYSVSDNPEKTLAVAAMNIANILDVLSEDSEELGDTELQDVRDTAYNAALEWAANWIIGAQLSGHGVEVQRYANTMAMSIRAAKRGRMLR